MVAIVVAAHKGLGDALIEAAEGIVGPLDAVCAVKFDYGVGLETLKQKLYETVDGLDMGEGVLILTDMFGGTPTNVSIPLLSPDRVAVLTGVNLPMLLKAQSARKEMKLAELCEFIRSYGVRNIKNAGEISCPMPQRD